MPTPFSEVISRRNWDVDRLVSLSDGVFAVALTIQALQFHAPQNGDLTGFPSVLNHEFGAIPSYLIGFAVIAAFWTTHHRMFRFVRRQDGGLLWLNFAFLALVCLLPFANELLHDFGAERVPSEFRYSVAARAVATYSVGVGLAGLALTAMWLYAKWRGLTDDEVDGPLTKYLAWRGLTLPIVFLPAAAVAAVQPLLAMFTWALVLPVRLGVNAWFKRRFTPAEEADLESG